MLSKRLSLTIIKKAVIETFDQDNVYTWNQCVPIAIPLRISVFIDVDLNTVDINNY